MKMFFVHMVRVSFFRFKKRFIAVVTFSIRKRERNPSLGSGRECCCSVRKYVHCIARASYIVKTAFKLFSSSRVYIENRFFIFFTRVLLFSQHLSFCLPSLTLLPLYLPSQAQAGFKKFK